MHIKISLSSKYGAEFLFKDITWLKKEKKNKKKKLLK